MQALRHVIGYGSLLKRWGADTKATDRVMLVIQLTWSVAFLLCRTCWYVIAESINLQELEIIAAERSKRDIIQREVATIQYYRDPFISELAKRNADGKCQLCQQPAPFFDKNDKPYLETHHVCWLSKGGADSVNNTVALCPNCHRKMHIINDPADVEFLLYIAKLNAMWWCEDTHIEMVSIEGSNDMH